VKTIVNWGVLGCAGIARKAMIPAILGSENGRLYAVASRTRQKLDEFSAEFHPEKTVLGYEELLDDPDVDAVYIPLPNSLHCEWVVRCCEKGKPVLCEKPLAMNASEVERIMEASRRTGVPVMEAFAYLHGPLMGIVREILQSGMLGRIKYIESNFSFLLNDLDNVRLIKHLGGGAAYDLGCYPVSFFRAVTGEEPDDIVQYMSTGEKSGVDEDTLLIMRFPSGAKATAYFSFQSNWCVRNLILGEYGQIDIPSFFDRSDRKSVFVTYGQSAPKEIAVDTSVRYIRQVEQMRRVVLEGAAPAVSLDFSLGNARALDRLLPQD